MGLFYIFSKLSIGSGPISKLTLNIWIHFVLKNGSAATKMLPHHFSSLCTVKRSA